MKFSKFFWIFQFFLKIWNFNLDFNLNNFFNLKIWNFHFFQIFSENLNFPDFFWIRIFQIFSENLSFFRCFLKISFFQGFFLTFSEFFWKSDFLQIYSEFFIFFLKSKFSRFFQTFSGFFIFFLKKIFVFHVFLFF